MAKSALPPAVSRAETAEAGMWARASDLSQMLWGIQHKHGHGRHCGCFNKVKVQHRGRHPETHTASQAGSWENGLSLQNLGKKSIFILKRHAGGSGSSQRLKP